jgi:hypothetical protein
MNSYLRLAAGIPAVSPACVALTAGVLVVIGEFGLAAGLPLGYGPIGYVLWSVSNYFFEVLEHRATGRPEWPVLSIETVVGRRRQLGIVFVLLAALVWLAHRAVAAALGGFAGLVFISLAVAATPASLAMLAVTGKPVRALNPVLLASAAARMQFDYCLALGAVLVAGAGVRLASARGGFLEVALASYGFLACAYVVGSIVYRHRIALGVRAPRAPEVLADRARARVERERSSVLDHAYGMASRGNRRGALAYVESYLKDESDPLAARAWMFERMTRWEDPGPALTFGRDLLERLDGADAADAAKLAQRCALLEEALKQRAIDLQ